MANSLLPMNNGGLFNIPLLYNQDRINKFVEYIVASMGESTCGIGEVSPDPNNYPTIFDFTGRAGILIVRHSAYTNWGHPTFSYLSDTYIWSGRLQYDPNTKQTSVEYYKYYQGVTP